MHEGQAFSLMDELDESGRDYLAKNPNLDLFKLLFSKKCILFEGISEEMLIRAYIDSRHELSDIELLSFHKGFIDIIEIWKKVNHSTGNRLGIIRDYDNQKGADMLTICKDIARGELHEFQMPKHIQEVLDFLKN